MITISDWPLQRRQRTWADGRVIVEIWDVQRRLNTPRWHSCVANHHVKQGAPQPHNLSPVQETVNDAWDSRYTGTYLSYSLTQSKQWRCIKGTGRKKKVWFSWCPRYRWFKSEHNVASDKQNGDGLYCTMWSKVAAMTFDFRAEGLKDMRPDQVAFIVNFSVTLYPVILILKMHCERYLCSTELEDWYNKGLYPWLGKISEGVLPLVWKGPAQRPVLCSDKIDSAHWFSPGCIPAAHIHKEAAVWRNVKCNCCMSIWLCIFLS